MKINNSKINSESSESFFNKNVNIFILFVFVLLITIGAVFLVYPKYIGVVETRKNNEKILADNSEKIKQINEIEKLLTNYNNIDPKIIENINSILPEKGVKEELYSFFYYLVSRNGLLLKSVILSEKEVSKNKSQAEEDSPQVNEFEIVKVNLNILGVNYLGLKNLLREIENSFLILNVQSINFSPSDSSLAIEIEINYLK